MPQKAEKHVAEGLLNELPRSLLNFIWYLWEVYFDPAIKESMFILQSGNNVQRVIIPKLNKSIEKDFSTAVDAIILIRKDGAKYYMSRQ
jgi:hypothetical protein